MTETEFIKHYVANAPQIMWFLGAGTSRTAGMPTATDVIWDLKLKYYCLNENQDVKKHDITNEVIRNRIQSYMDSKGFPAIWSAEEYSHYFDLTFNSDYASQQKYLTEQLNDKKISLNIGHRALAGLIAAHKAKIIFTTNFDGVIESAYAKVAQNNLDCFHLEGSYAALEALNAEQFPIYAKIHGDFKYQSVKNLASDLLSNDKKIQDCFLAAATRYGIVVTGYSGRDVNVMEMFSKAIEQHNAFPKGLIWTVPKLSSITLNVVAFIHQAKEKGINAHIVEAGTFDIMLSKIWRQIVDKTDELDKRVRTATTVKVAIALPAGGNNYPVVRTNALPILEMPNSCAAIQTTIPLSNSEVKDILGANKPNAVITKADKIVAWGSPSELMKAFGDQTVASIDPHNIPDAINLISDSTFYHSFYERGLWRSLGDGKPLIGKSDKGYWFYVDGKKNADSVFQSLKAAVGFKDQPGNIFGKIPGSDNVFWAEGIKIRAEVRNGSFWLLLTPAIWIEPTTERQNFKEFIKQKRGSRYNSKASQILDAWIEILFGKIGVAEGVEVSCFSETQYPIKFKVSTRTAFSRK